MKSIPQFSKQKGYSLLELGIVIVIIGAFAAGAVALGNILLGNSKYDFVKSNHETILNGVMKHFGRGAFYSSTASESLSTTYISNMKIVDAENIRTVSGKKVITTGLGDDSYLYVEATGSTDPNSMVMRYEDVPARFCDEGLIALEKRASSITVTPVGGSVTTVKDATGLKRGSLSTACSAADLIDVSFYYKN